MYTKDELTLIALCSFEELTYKTAFTLMHGLESPILRNLRIC